MKKFEQYFLLLAFSFLLSACDRKADPVEPVPDPSAELKVLVTAVDGILSKEGVVSDPKFVIVIEGEEANYTVSYTLDGKDGKIEKAFPEENQVVTVTGTDEVSEHVLTGRVSRDATGEEVSFKSSVWMRWPALTEKKGSITILGVTKDFSSTAETVDRHVVMTVDVKYKNTDTPVEYLAYNHETVSLDRIERVEDGHVRMTAITTEKSDDAWVGVVLVNGNLRDTLVQRIVCNGKESDMQHVTDFTVEGFEGESVDVPMRSTLTFRINPFPSMAMDAGNVSVSIAGGGVATVEGKNREWTVKPVWIGTTSMTITVGEITKTYPLNVTGTPVSDFSIAKAFTATDWTTGTSVSDLIVPVPSDAFDADEMRVRSLTPSVLSVAEGVNGIHTMTALSYGSAEVEVSTGHCTKKIEIAVHQDIDLSGINGTYISWGEERSFIVKGHFSDFSIISSADKFWDISRKGNEISITNMMEKSSTPRSACDVTLKLRTADNHTYSAAFRLDAVPDRNSSTITYVGDTDGGGKAVFLLTFINGTDSDVDYSQYQGFILSHGAMTGNHMETASERLLQGMTYNLSDGGGTYARFYDFHSLIPGLDAGDVILVPSMSARRWEIEIPFSGDDYGKYSSGFGGVMRSCPDGPSAKWTYWSF